MKIQLRMICSRRSWVEVEVVTSFVSHSGHIRDKFGKTVIKNLMAETLVIESFPAALEKSR